MTPEQAIETLRKLVGRNNEAVRVLADALAERDMARDDFKRQLRLGTEDVRRERDAAVAERDKLRAALATAAEDSDYCYVCDRHPSSGHADDCPIGRAALVSVAPAKERQDA